jgi:hypothetical protein
MSFVKHSEEQINSSEFDERAEQKYYLCDYWHEGEQWCIEIPAYSWEDAQKRLRSLSQGKVVGEIRLTVPAHFGWLAKLLAWLKNL